MCDNRKISDVSQVLWLLPSKEGESLLREYASSLDLSCPDNLHITLGYSWSLDDIEVPSIRPKPCPLVRFNDSNIVSNGIIKSLALITAAENAYGLEEFIVNSLWESTNSKLHLSLAYEVDSDVTFKLQKSLSIPFNSFAIVSKPKGGWEDLSSWEIRRRVCFSD